MLTNPSLQVGSLNPAIVPVDLTNSHGGIVLVSPLVPSL